MLAGPVLVFSLWGLLTDWEREGKAGTLGELDATIALTTVYLLFHIVLYLLGSFNGAPAACKGGGFPLMRAAHTHTHTRARLPGAHADGTAPGPCQACSSAIATPA